MQCRQRRRSQTRCLRPHSRRRRLCTKVCLGHLARRRDRYPAARSRFITFQAVMRLPNTSNHPRGSEMKRFIIFCLPHASSDKAALGVYCAAILDQRILAWRPEFSPPHTENWPVMTTRYLPQNVLRHISRHDAINKTRKQKEDRIQNASCNQPTISHGVLFRSDSTWVISLPEGLDTRYSNKKRW